MSAINAMDGTNPQSTEQQPNAEKMLPQSEVDKLARGARLDGEQRALQKLDQQAAEIAALKQQLQQLSQGMQPQGGAPNGGMQQPQQQPGGQPQGDTAAIVRQEMASQQQMALLAEQDRQVGELLGHFDKEMDNAPDHLEDFKQVTSKFNRKNFPEIALMAAQMDNMHAVMYELAKNPGKIADILKLGERDPKLAFAQMQELSESLKQNEKAVANHKSPLKPLTSVKASVAGTDNSKRSVTDWKKFYRNRR